MPPGTSIVLLIDGMPECDCQHAMNAGTRDLTTGITCDPEHARVKLAVCFAIYFPISLHRFDKTTSCSFYTSLKHIITVFMDVERRYR